MRTRRSLWVRWIAVLWLVCVCLPASPASAGETALESAATLATVSGTIRHNGMPVAGVQVDVWWETGGDGRTTGAETPNAEAVADGDTISAMQELARSVPVASHVTAYAARLLTATHPGNPSTPEVVQRYVRYGASPRGKQALILAGKILALLDGRYNVAFDDLRAAALPALRHRLLLNFEAQAEGISTDSVIADLLKVISPE